MTSLSLLGAFYERWHIEETKDFVV